MGKTQEQTKTCLDKFPSPGTVPEFYPLEEVPVPGQGAQIFSLAPTKDYIRTSACFQELSTGT